MAESIRSPEFMEAFAAVQRLSSRHVPHSRTVQTIRSSQRSGNQSWPRPSPPRIVTERQSDPAPEMHIENRRLFHVAFGRLKLAEWEQNHLHGCKVCQGLLYVLIHQPVTGVPDNLEKPGDAA